MFLYRTRSLTRVNMTPSFMLLLLFLVLQASAHIIKGVKYTPNFPRVEGENTSFTWEDGHISVSESFDIVAGKSSTVLAVAGEEEERFHNESVNCIQPKTRDMTLFVVFDPRGEEDFGNQLEAVKDLQMHCTAQQIMSCDKPNSYLYPNLEFALVEISLRQADNFNPQQKSGIDVLADAAHYVDENSMDHQTDKIFTQQKNGINTSKDVVEYVEGNSSYSTEKALNFEYGDQVKHPWHVEPLIVLWAGRMLNSVCSSLTGKIHQYSSGKLIYVPEDEKIKMDKKVSEDGRYKYIIRGSEVYYRPEGREEYLRCKVVVFSFGYLPTLDCGGEFLEATWENMWPVEAVEYIPNLILFNNSNNNNADTCVVGSKREHPRSSDSSFTRRKKRTVVANFPAHLVFKHYAQVSFDNGNIPYLHCGNEKARMPFILNTKTGEFKRTNVDRLSSLPEDKQIPLETKLRISDNGVYKIITNGSYAIYLQEGIFYPCKVTACSRKTKLRIICLSIGELNEPDWYRTFPIEAYHLVKDLATSVYGFGAGEQVTTGMLKEKIVKITSTNKSRK